MEIEIKVQSWAEVDLEELAALTLAARQASPFWVERQTEEVFRNYILRGKDRWSPSVVVTAYRGGKLVGWLCLITEDPLLFELWRWHPFIDPKEDEAAVAEQLLQACIGFAKEKRVQSLEVCCDFRKEQMTGEAENHYRRYKGWYEKQGLKKIDETVYLTRSAADILSLAPPEVSSSLAITAYEPDYRQATFECFLQAFSAGQDRSFLEKTSQQRESLFDYHLDEYLNLQASMILLEEGSVKGFSIVQSRPHIGDEHMAMIGVSPAYQGQGWGRKLLTASMQEAARQGGELFSLGVDLANEAAHNLYSSMGFETQTKLVNHVWKNEM